MSEICNDLVDQARKFVTAPELRHGPRLGGAAAHAMLRVCEQFKPTFYDLLFPPGHSRRIDFGKPTHTTESLCPVRSRCTATVAPSPRGC